MINENIRLVAGAARRWRLSLVREDSSPVDLSAYRFYGGAASRYRKEFRTMETVSTAPDEVILQLPPLPYGERWHHQIYMQDSATSREWLILSGSIDVLERLGEDASASTIAEAESYLRCTLSSTTDELEGTFLEAGPRGPQGEQGPKGDKGDPGAALTYDDLTAEQKAELIAPLGYAAVDVAPEGTTEENYNAYGFGFEMPRAGRITGLTLECRDNNTATPADTPVWLKVWRGTTLIARSENSQQHAVAAVLSYSFAAPFEVAAGEEIKVSFHAEEGLAETGYYMGRQCCLRVVAKDPDTPGGLLGDQGGYGADSDPTQRSWQAKHTWHMLVGVFAPAEHVEDTTAHITEAERTTWNEAAAREVPEAYTLTAEEVQAVVPIAWKGTGTMPTGVTNSIVFGFGASSSQMGAIVLGHSAVSTGGYIVIGTSAKGSGSGGIALGSHSVARGSNTIAIGFSAVSSATFGIAMGYGAESRAEYSAAFGPSSEAVGEYSVAVGGGAEATGEYSVALGPLSEATARRSVAIGKFAKSQDDDLIVMSVGETTGGSIRTHFCFMGQGSPLANTYEGGEACMGYVVADGDGNIITSGTRKLSELFTNNVGTFCPTGFVLGTGPEPPIYD